jgi:hypothetical protein
MASNRGGQCDSHPRRSTRVAGDALMLTTAEIQARGMRTLAQLRTANGEYYEMLLGNLAYYDAMLTARVLGSK